MGLVAVGLDQPRAAEIGGQRLRRRDVAVDAGKAALALDDLLARVEAAFGEERCQHAILRRLAGVERLAHGAAVLLHAARLRRRDAERVRHPLRVEAEEAPARRARRDRPERAGEMPAALMVAGRAA